MGDMHEMQQPAAGRAKSSFSTITNILGAGLSLALLVGVGVWGYKLLMRDVTGVPVVRAAEGPMRVQPENPGGQQAQNQGLSVNNVAAVGTAGAPADRLMLAPSPMDLTEEDEAALPELAAGVAPVVDSELAAVLTETPRTPEEETIQLAAVEELAARLADGVAPLTDLQPAFESNPAAQPGVEPEEDEDSTAGIADEETGEGVAPSLRPRARPAVFAPPSQAEAIAEAVAAAQDIAADSIPVGTRLAQLGAYDSAEIARSEWDRLNARFGEYLEDKNRVIQKATSGGRTFYRLRAMGFADLSDARRFCSALVAEKAECIPVVTR